MSGSIDGSVIEVTETGMRPVDVVRPGVSERWSAVSAPTVVDNEDTVEPPFEQPGCPDADRLDRVR
ncbi:hypothetical protein AB0F93_16560 [Micromonospora tulbaghiae]|uniref:hypothetical protein n=1 Tax=Micromonospora tulbaghiae TaxID=479978 RepID=UPI00332B0DD8